MKTRKTAALVPALMGTLFLAACSAADPSGDMGEEATQNVAVLLASTQNAYNQAVLAGIEEEAERQGINIKVFDGQFDSTVQLSQLENLRPGQFDGVVVLPNDGVSLASAFPLADGMPVVTITNPIGPDIVSMDPQTEGVISTVGVSPELIGETQAMDVARYCEKVDPCKVVQVVGFLTAPLDVAITAAYDRVLNTYENIDVVATVEGEYDRDKALNAVSNVLQAHPDVNVVLSNTDQQTSGIEVALESAGLDPAGVYLTGTGGTAEAVEAVRSGRWKSTYAAFPVQRGEAALSQLVSHLTGGTVAPKVDADELGDVPAWITQDVLEEHPDFQGDWKG